MKSSAVAAAIGRIDPNVVMTFTPLEQQVNAALVQVLAMLSGSFGCSEKNRPLTRRSPAASK